jgi:hypothetical protein
MQKITTDLCYETDRCSTSSSETDVTYIWDDFDHLDEIQKVNCIIDTLVYDSRALFCKYEFSNAKQRLKLEIVEPNSSKSLHLGDFTMEMLKMVEKSLFSAKFLFISKLTYRQ